MPRFRHTVEQILAKLSEAEVALSKGQSVAHVCSAHSIIEQTYYRWRNEYGGLKVDQVKRLKDLERENTRLKRAIGSTLLESFGIAKLSRLSHQSGSPVILFPL